MQRAPGTAGTICVALLMLCCAARASADDAAPLEPNWHEAVLQLTINGTAAGDDFIVLRDVSDGLWITEEDFQRLRLRPPQVAPRIADGRRFLPLAAIAGTRISYDDAHSAASISAPGAAFDSTHVSFTGNGPRPPLSHSGTGAFLNYEFYGQTGQYSGADVASAYAELGFFSPLGVLTSTGVGTRTQTDHSYVRLETTFTHDFPNSLETLRLGDAISVPGSWAQAVRFGGLQWGSNYGIRPDLVTTPLLAVSGTAVVPSTVDVFVNGKAVGSSPVPAGPFVVNQVPALNGAGDVSIVVRNALGQQQIVSLPFYSAPVMLQPGLSLWDIDVGALRENFGLESADYGPAMASATWRHGFSATTTAEFHAEGVHGGPAAAGFDVAQALDHWAVVTVNIAVGGEPDPVAVIGVPAQPSSSGAYQALGIQHVDEHFSFMLQAQHASPGFREVGNLGGVPTPLERYLAQAGLNLAHSGSLQAAFVAQHNADDTRQQTIGVSYQVNLWRGSLGVNVSHTSGDTHDTSCFIFYALPLGGRLNSSTTLRYDNQLQAPKGALVQTLQKNLPVGPGDGYLLSAGTDGSYNAEYIRQFDALTLDAAAARFADASAQRLGVGGIPNVTVFFDNQPVGRTDDNGLALVPNLRSFDVNRLSIDPLQLPLDATVTDTQVQIVPPYRSGNLVRFPVQRVHSGVFRLQRADGKPVPAGAVVKFQGEEFPVGLDGLTYVTGYDHGTTGEARWAGGQCRFRLPPPPAGEPQPDVGIIACRSAP